MRVNPNYTADVVSLLDQTQADQTKALQELSTGRRVNQPSDDPAAEAAMIDENSRSAAADQFTASSSSLTDALNTADSTLSSVVTALQRASTLAVEGANGTMNQSDLNSIAQEISGIQSQVLSLANTSYAGQYLFAGTATGTAPYAADASDPTQIDYLGNDKQNQVQIGTGLSVYSNLPGSSIFSQSGANVFTALQSLVTALKSGDSTSIAAAGTSIDSAADALSTARVFYGNTVNEITSNENYLSQEKLNIATYENTLVSSDTATATTDMTQAETAYNSTIAAAAKMDQVSLLDYLQ
jgi:flagellar hook-associated protein 3 FlgL